jgi:hypothetical protein
MMTRRTREAATLLAAALTLGLAGAAWGSTAKIPSNPCKLKIAAQVKALRLSKACAHRKPAPGPLGKVSSGTWGKQPHVLGIGFFAFSSRSKQNEFKQSFFTIGTNVKHVGSNAVESITPAGVAYAGIVKGIGINLSVNEATASSAVKAKDAKTVLKLVKALTAQL